MLIFVRHGERLDQVKEIPPGMKVDFAYDPQLTPAGMKMDSDAAILTKSFLMNQGYKTPSFTFISSPHYRTL